MTKVNSREVINAQTAKKSAFALALTFLCFGLADAADKQERIRIYGPFGSDRFVTGDMVPAGKMNGHLYLDRKCSLPLADSKNMRHLYWTNHSLFRVGCWYPTLDDGFVMIYSNGETEKQPSWKMMPKAMLNKDGSAQINEPDYDSSTVAQKVLAQQTSDMMKRRARGEY